MTCRKCSGRLMLDRYGNLKSWARGKDYIVALRAHPVISKGDSEVAQS